MRRGDRGRKRRGEGEARVKQHRLLSLIPLLYSVPGSFLQIVLLTQPIGQEGKPEIYG